MTKLVRPVGICCSFFPRLIARMRIFRQLAEIQLLQARMTIVKRKSVEIDLNGVGLLALEEGEGPAG